MMFVSLLPSAVLVIRGKRGSGGHGVLTPSRHYQDLAVGPGQAVAEHTVPFTAPPQGATLQPPSSVAPAQVAKSRGAREER